MAIQSRRGAYNKFDPQKLLPGEWAVVISGDPNAADGLAVYMCFKAGTVKRMATYEDMVENIKDASGEVVAEEIAKQTAAVISACQTAAQDANTAKNGANTAAQTAAQAAQDAENATDSANAALAAARKVLNEWQGLEDASRVTALEEAVEQIKDVIKDLLSTV